ncbi:mitochondrial transcription rescue factor 1-like [Diadema antillarum]|uniref:mitochondrial transcription rescue factor 1-like n=1 Tax=Diadema antillarum TaxID=105358 RepID=UPI003A895B29
MKSLYGIQTNLGQYSHSLSTRAVLVQPCQVRHYSTKKSKSKTSLKSKNNARDLEDQDASDESSSDAEEEEEEEEEDWNPDDEVDEAKKDWKDLKMSVPSLRIDAILSAGLGISRKKVEDAFLSAKLRHNGQKVTKKSKQVAEGDILDVVRDDKVATKDDDQGMVVMRVAVMRVKGERSASDRIPVRLRRWKRLEVPHKK